MSGILSGILIALVAAWIWHGLGRIWRGGIAEEAATALDCAAELGLRVWPARHQPAWWADGTLDGVRVRITWIGGLLGERTRIDIGGLRRTVPLIRDASALLAALSGAEE